MSSRHSSFAVERLVLPCCLAALAAPIGAQAGPWQEHEIETQPSFPRALEAVDLDGDGDPDVQGGSRWYENAAGDGSTWESHDTSGGDHSLASDLDRDGDLDLLAFGAGVSWTENVDGSGPGNVTHRIYDAPTTVDGIGFSVEDLDLDGDPDVVSGYISHDAILWHENTAGDGSSWRNQAVTAQAHRITSLSTADIDGDGAPDVFSGETSFTDPVGYFWYENRLAVGFSWAKHLMAGSQIADSRTIRAVDVDGDGDADAAVASHWAPPSTYNSVAWLENTAGDGSAWTRHLLRPTELVRTDALVPVDLDRDGEPDLLRATDAGLSWMENPAVGANWPDRILFSGSPSEQCAAGDVDSDGDRDVLAVRRPTGEAKLNWYENETPLTPYGSDVNPPRSLIVSSGTIAAGESVVFGLDNPLGTQTGGALTFLYVSLAPDAHFPAGTLLPGFGMSAPGASGELLTSGPRARFTGPPWSSPGNPALISTSVPDSPGLVGLDAFLQGLLIDPSAPPGVRFGLTNALRATIGP